MLPHMVPPPPHTPLAKAPQVHAFLSGPYKSPSGSIYPHGIYLGRKATLWERLLRPKYILIHVHGPCKLGVREGEAADFEFGTWAAWVRRCLQLPWLAFTPRAQYPVVKEIYLKPYWDPSYDLRYIPSLRGIGLFGSRTQGGPFFLGFRFPYKQLQTGKGTFWIPRFLMGLGTRHKP